MSAPEAPPQDRVKGASVVLGQLHGFVDMLRQNSVRVGVAEVMDAFQALELLGDSAFETRATLHGTLRTTLVKTQADALAFDRLFDLYFSGRLDLDDRLTDSLFNQLLERMHGDGEVAALMQILENLDGQMSALTRAVLGAQVEQLTQMFQRGLQETDLSGLQNRLQLGYFSQRLLSRMGVRALETDLELIRGTLAGQMGQGQVDAAMAALEERASALRSTARRTLEDELRKRDVRADDGTRNLLDKSFARLSPLEVLHMRAAVRQLAERLKTVVKRRRKERRGLLDVRRTLRANMGLGGIPANVHFRRRRKDRPQLVVLCDVSDSVRHASMFMLQLVYTLQELFTRVRSFVFVSDLGEVTDVFRQHPLEQAVDLSVAGKTINLYANSNFGRAFLLFHRHHLDAVTRNSTVLVLGDGRNNYNPANAWLLGEWRRRAHKLIWLCTEDRGTWGFGDSEMPAYARHCDTVEVVQNLRQLQRAVDLMLR